MSLLGEFKKAYPDAKLIAVEEAIQKHQGEGIKFDGCTCPFLPSRRSFLNPSGSTAWGKDAPDTKYGFEDDVSLSTQTFHRMVDN